MTDLQKEIQYIKGVGPVRAKLLGRLGIKTIEDLLYYTPFRYEDRGNIKPIGELIRHGADESYQTVQGKVMASGIVITPRQRKKIFEATIGDGSGYITAKWFNQPYLKDVLKKEKRVVVSGHVRRDPYSYGLYMDGPEFEIIDDEEGELIHTGRIVPIYHVTSGLTQKVMRNIIKGLLDLYPLPEILPQGLLDKYHLPGLHDAVNQIHFPPERSEMDLLNRGGTRSHKRLSFEEFLLLELGLAIKKSTVTQESGIAFKVDGPMIRRLHALLPFRLTSSQQRVIDEIMGDMAGLHPMNRLLQGDVGCGKTIVALTAILIAVENGYQAALMAPTEILAEQHYRNIQVYLDPLGVTSRILTSGITSRKREAILKDTAEGGVQVVIGTHALLEGGVVFKRLGLAVVDEQHKFGVLQRATLKRKGYNPDVLIMTATPIPRTLAMSVYGDLDLSVIDELPPGRIPVITKWLYGDRRKEAYSIMKEGLREGKQVYVVYPLVEESEKVDLKGATEMAERLQRAFPDNMVGLLHGRLNSVKKEEIMGRFKRNEIRILVSTTVVEVGVDVPNATVMIIEHAERFGLSQLHQLRGRVGRGGGKSYCLLLTNGKVTEEGRRRLSMMARTNNGFEIAEEDMAIRGPGEFFGTRQSGIPELRVANLLRDVKILEAARKEAFEIIAKDPALERPEHRLLRHAMEQKWRDKLELATVS
ncbi:MAG: ATP-dependent DNA helicase RecG [Nitrospirae bacterium]|nr:ATP-dependent DNA helicase RecG [Nitrospirota bacterium]